MTGETWTTASGEADKPAREPLSQLTPKRTEVEAAKLKILVDRRLGQATPEWVFRVAKGLPPVAPAS